MRVVFGFPTRAHEWHEAGRCQRNPCPLERRYIGLRSKGPCGLRGSGADLPFPVGPHMSAGPALPKPNTSAPDSLADWPALQLNDWSIIVTYAKPKEQKRSDAETETQVPLPRGYRGTGARNICSSPRSSFFRWECPSPDHTEPGALQRVGAATAPVRDCASCAIDEHASPRQQS